MVRVSPDTSNQPEVTEEVMGDTMTHKTMTATREAVRLLNSA